MAFQPTGKAKSVVAASINPRVETKTYGLSNEVVTGVEGSNKVKLPVRLRASSLLSESVSTSSPLLLGRSGVTPSPSPFPSLPPSRTTSLGPQGNTRRGNESQSHSKFPQESFRALHQVQEEQEKALQTTQQEQKSQEQEQKSQEQEQKSQEQEQKSQEQEPKPPEQKPKEQKQQQKKINGSESKAEEVSSEVKPIESIQAMLTKTISAKSSPLLKDKFIKQWESVTAKKETNPQVQTYFLKFDSQSFQDNQAISFDKNPISTTSDNTLGINILPIFNSFVKFLKKNPEKPVLFDIVPILEKLNKNTDSVVQTSVMDSLYVYLKKAKTSEGGGLNKQEKKGTRKRKRPQHQPS